MKINTKEELIKIIQEEGDYYHFLHNGFPCYLIRNKDVWNGYVGVSQNSPLFGITYGIRESSDKNIEFIRKVCCHGGLKFAGDIRTITKETNRHYDNYWYFGFDTASSNDLCLSDFDNKTTKNKEYRDYMYCVKECRNIVNQISKFSIK